LLARCGALFLAAALALLAPAPAEARKASYRGEILWDSYGVPHVYGRSEEAVFYGFGWAQAQGHGDLILRLYGEARGRAAEYWGEKYAETDRYLLTNGAPARAKAWYAAQTPAFKAKLDAFAAGITAYAAAHPDKIAKDVAVVLPITGEDVVAHAHRLSNFVYVAPPARVMGAGGPQSGSNAWAIAPGRSADGRAMLLANPHLGWPESFFTYTEAHLNGPGVHVYGATQVGLPILRFAFNERMGFTNTVNGILASTLYELTPVEGGYRFDGAVKPFATRTETLKIKGADGALREERLDIRESVHGPVFVRKDGKTVALRVAGLDRPFFLEQYWQMATARSFDAYMAAMRRLQVPTFNIVYADREGHIAYVHNGLMPKRASGDRAYWAGLVPGDVSATLWTDIHPFDDLPQVIDPPSGFVQNANDPPWLATWPQAIRPEDHPAYAAAPGPFSLRAQNSVKMIAEDDKVSFAEFQERKLSTFALMTERVLGELVAAAAADADPQVQAAAQVLKAWNGRYDADARGALLFEAWAQKFAGPQLSSEASYAKPWSAADPLATPAGLKDPKAAVEMLRAAAAETMEKYGALDRPFGDVSRFKLRGVSEPGHGGFGNLGIFRVMTWGALEAGERAPNHGETWVSMVAFGRPTTAVGLMSYGNSTQPGSPHRTDQLKALSESRFRTLPLTRRAAEAASVARTRFNHSVTISN
jgi:acyl-homoserine-lactone acylase